ncbi:MAG: transporter substrate-binding domain-containing protein [Solibacillus sp.]
MNFKKLIGIVTLASSIALLGACGSDEAGSSSAEGKTTIKVALTDEVTPPFLFTDDDNNPIGYDVDILNIIEERLPQYNFEYVWGEEETNLIGVSTSKYDMAANWFFKNPEREEKFLYPELEYGYSLTSLVTKDDRDDIKSLDDMVGKTFPPMAATGGLRAILNGYNAANPDAQLTLESVEHPSTGDNLKRVQDGRADSIFLNVVTFESIEAEATEGLKISGIVSKEPVYFVFNKEHTELAAQFDDIIGELKEDGTLSELAEKWFGVDFFQDLEFLNQEQYNFGK